FRDRRSGRNDRLHLDLLPAAVYGAGRRQRGITEPLLNVRARVEVRGPRPRPRRSAAVPNWSAGDTIPLGRDLLGSRLDLDPGELVGTVGEGGVLYKGWAAAL